MCLTCATALDAKSVVMQCPQCVRAITSFGEVPALREAARVTVATSHACSDVVCPLTAAACRVAPIRVMSRDAVLACLTASTQRWYAPTKRKRTPHLRAVAMCRVHVVDLVVVTSCRDQLRDCACTLDIANSFTIDDVVHVDVHMSMAYDDVVFRLVRQHSRDTVSRHRVRDLIAFETAASADTVADAIERLQRSGKLVVDANGKLCAP